MSGAIGTDLEKASVASVWEAAERHELDAGTSGGS